MMEVWKFRLGPGVNIVRMPAGARILSAGFQGPGLYVWAIVTPMNGAIARSVYVVGTGHPVPGDVGEYVGTAQDPAGEGFVWHVFDGSADAGGGR